MVVPHDDGPRWFHRKTPLVGRKLWFGPRRAGGWGWTPVSWEGWAISAPILVIALVGPFVAPSRVSAPVVVVLVAVFLSVAAVKGTSPGGSRLWREMNGPDPGDR